MGLGQMYSTSDTVTTRLTVADVIKIIDPTDVPCVMHFGLANQGKFKFESFPNHKYTWLEDTYRVKTATLGSSTAVSSTTDTAPEVASGHGTRFHVGDVWKVDETGELWLVTAHSGADTLTTVIRNWGAAQGGAQGTAEAAVTDGGTLTFLYSARREGATSTDYPWTVPTSVYNFSQIFHGSVFVSGSEQDATTRYGITDAENRQIMKYLGGVGGGNGRKGRAGDGLEEIEKTFFYGQKVERTSSTVEGGMGGFKEFVTTNVFDQGSNTVRLTQKILEDAIQACWGYGGKPNVIICNAFQKRLIDSWYTPAVQTVRTESTGGSVIKNIETNFGILSILLNRHCPTDEVYICQDDLIGWVTLRDFKVEELAKTGDGAAKQIIGEYGFVLQSEKAHAVITDLATT